LPPLTGSNEGPNYAGPVVKDREGHEYPTVFMGNGQHWMSANLRTTVFCNGTPIATGLSPQEWGPPNTTPAYAVYNDVAAYADTFGLLYNGYAADEGHCLCPEGWHVPTKQEWDDLVLYLDPGANPANWEPFSSVAGGALKDLSPLWLAPNDGATNSARFFALPGGERNFIGDYLYKSIEGNWWSSSTWFAHNAAALELRYESPFAYRPTFRDKVSGYSVRCIRNTALYRPGPGVSDHEGNVYPTVILYNGQEWMTSNLRVTTFRNGEHIPDGPFDWESPGPRSGSYEDAGVNDAMGRVYSWWATGDPRGICPLGWHVPTRSEWIDLERALGLRSGDIEQNGWQDRGAAEDVGGKLKRTTLWNAPNMGADNTSGLALEPGGIRSFTPRYHNTPAHWSYEKRGDVGYWWTSSAISDGNGWYRAATTWSNGFLQSTMDMRNGLCVRCMKDQ